MTDSFGFTLLPGATVIKQADYTLYWDEKGAYYAVTHPSIGGLLCKIYPYKGEAHHNLADPKKMYTIKADNFPGVGQLDQMVKGSDLPDYLDSVRAGRLHG